MSEEPKPAPGIGPSLGGSGPCPTIETPAQTWTVGHPTQEAKARLELLALQLAAENHEAALPVLPALARARKEAAFVAAIDGGHYRTFGPMWLSVNSGPDGNAAFLLSLLREHHPAATIADARKLMLDESRKVRAALAAVVPGFFSVLVEGLPLTPEERALKVAEMTAELLSNLGPLAPTA